MEQGPRTIRLSVDGEDLFDLPRRENTFTMRLRSPAGETEIEYTISEALEEIDTLKKRNGPPQMIAMLEKLVKRNHTPLVGNA